jgi:GntR family transcriptional repressor for pyruvate dehydrogenase complex
MEFNRIGRGRIYAEIVDRIRETILSGESKPGDKLPTEKELAEQFDVSRGTVREAMSVLETAGLVEIKHGWGTFVSCNVNKSFLDSIGFMFLLERDSSQELLEVRKIIEPRAAELAAKRASDAEKEDLQEISAKILSMPTITAFDDEEIDIDLKLHFLIAKASKNMVLMKMMNTIAALYQESLKEYRKHTMVSETRLAELHAEHLSLIEAVIAGDGAKAHREMEKHLEAATTTLRLLTADVNGRF